ncbi:NUDIX hydrolase [Candidatus Parcubacteria bacterium]|jgi:ADP-ribose pyrophosphatase YjhB (NUDIX family)|nr:NUDIX hydrolase [Candidatus Parcubacteria bacterium]MBT7227964.1 NUDIX hydrolase [Candidatus Parcubacteria bacterium]
MPKIIIASGPVIVENNKVLLDNHGDTDFWKFCGGRVNDLEENLIDTAKRKAKEELGIDIEIIDNTPFITYASKDNMDIILVHFLAKRIGEIKPSADIREWNWHDLDNLPDKLGPNIIPVLKHFDFIK